MHALGNLAGEARSENSVILNGAAEETLRFLIYEAASRSPKLTPSVSRVSLSPFSVLAYGSGSLCNLFFGLRGSRAKWRFQI